MGEKDISRELNPREGKNSSLFEEKKTVACENNIGKIKTIIYE